VVGGAKFILRELAVQRRLCNGIASKFCPSPSTWQPAMIHRQLKDIGRNYQEKFDDIASLEIYKSC
jgi:hypothetical protein